MITKELAKKIRYIQIYTNKAVNDVLAGEYESVFKGRGMEFDEVRQYQPGDDVRSIDWNVTARIGEPYVKRFVEERDLTIMFLVDMSASGRFGSVSKLKNETAAEICALLAFSAIKNNDKVGLIVFTDVVEMFIPPGKGAAHVLYLIRELLGFQPGKSGTNINAALEYFGKITKRKCVVFLVSDFQDSDYEKPMRVLSKRHDLISISITDPRELSMPNVGLIELEDAETGEPVVFDTSNANARKAFEKTGANRLAALRKTFRSMNVDHIDVVSGRDYVRDIINFFKKREKRLAV